MPGVAPQEVDMKTRPTIKSIEIFEFEHEMNDVGAEPTIGIPIYKPGGKGTRRTGAIKIHTDSGTVGEYVGGGATEYAAIPGLAPTLIGRGALNREDIYNDVKQATRQQARMGQGVLDMALWDLAGKYYDAPIYELLGGTKKKLPCYASTYVGDHEADGLGSPEAYADFAEHCLELGYPGFKIHGWQDAPIDQQIALVHAVGRRVGGKMDLMLDPFCAIETFGDAYKLGRACDEENFFWYEDPFKDGGVSMHAHRKLRQLIKTPLLQLEHLRGLESHVDFIEAEATDFVRGDPDYDGGVTGMMKIAHAAEGFGLDVELHGPGPVRRQIMASMRNSNYYEMGLLHPKLPPFHAPVYKDDYEDQIDSIDENGCVEVPDGPGLGIDYDWDYIQKNQTSHAEFK
jgi:L-alanine-DL-glutamate epimerase-like enolase superfamily enzyme